jgi:beta-glucanase (GH16 family)
MSARRGTVGIGASVVFAQLWLLASCSGGAPEAVGASGDPESGAQIPAAGMNAAAPAALGSEQGSTSGSSEVAPELPLSMQAPGVEATRFVSDACALDGAKNGWGPIERDFSNGEEQVADGGPISLANVVYGKGLGMHAPSEVSFALSGGCRRFSAFVGVDDEMKAAGSVGFQVWGDGVLLTETGVLTGADAAQALDVDVSGVQTLRLVVLAGDGSGSDHADWADARLLCSGELPACPAPLASVPPVAGYDLVWADEFDVDGPPSADNWSFENGFVRNEEEQWYQPENAQVRAGFLIIEGRRERRPNPNYRAGSADWKTNRQFADYTSASLHSRAKQSFRFGRLEMRGRFPAYAGLWPAWWTLGNNGEWPWNGEVDILEFYQGSLHANFVVGTDTQWEGNWNARATALSALGDADWDAQFHIYRMDWDATRITLSVDGQALNALNLSDLRNPDGQSPFLNPAYMLLNLAIGGAAGNAAAVPFPTRYEIDYVRVFKSN